MGIAYPFLLSKNPTEDCLNTALQKSNAALRLGTFGAVFGTALTTVGYA